MVNAAGQILIEQFLVELTLYTSILLLILWLVDKWRQRRRIKKDEAIALKDKYYEDLRMSRLLHTPTKEYVDLSQTIVFANDYRRPHERIQ